MIRLLAVAVVALAAAVVVPLSTASAPIRAVFDLDAVTFPDAYLTDACGVGVDVTITGTIHVTLFVDNEGHATHEVDTFNGTITFPPARTPSPCTARRSHGRPTRKARS